MSKICSEISEPQTFGQLEILTDWLLRVTSALEADFRRKCESMNERHSEIISNEDMLMHIDQQLNVLASAVSYVDKETQHMDYLLQELDNVAYKLDSLQGINVFERRVKTKSERTKFLDLFHTTNDKIEQLQLTLTDIQVIREYCIQPSAYDIILQILDCHQAALCNTEKQLDLMSDKLMQISGNYSDLGVVTADTTPPDHPLRINRREEK